MLPTPLTLRVSSRCHTGTMLLAVRAKQALASAVL
jgi:hypothetical protein